LRLARVLAAVVVAAVCAWFVLGIVQTNALNNASSIVTSSQTLSAPQLRHVQSLLHTAGQLNPDAQVDLVRAQAEAEAGDRAAAVRTLETVARREPDNGVVWKELAETAHDPQTIIRAEERIAALLPKVPHS
jgi:predicted Zn-dependent protease